MVCSIAMSFNGQCDIDIVNRVIELLNLTRRVYVGLVDSIWLRFDKHVARLGHKANQTVTGSSAIADGPRDAL